MYYSSTSLFHTFERWYFNHHPFNHAPAKVFVENVTVSTKTGVTISPFTSGVYCIDEKCVVCQQTMLHQTKYHSVCCLTNGCTLHVVTCFYNCEGITARRWSVKMTKDDHQSSHVRDTLYGMQIHTSRNIPYATMTHSWPLICQNWWVPFAYVIAPPKQKIHECLKINVVSNFIFSCQVRTSKNAHKSLWHISSPKKLTSNIQNANTMINLAKLQTQLRSRRHDILPALTKVGVHDQAPLDHSTSQYHTGHCLQKSHVLVRGGWQKNLDPGPIAKNMLRCKRSLRSEVRMPKGQPCLGREPVPNVRHFEQSCFSSSLLGVPRVFSQ